MIVFVLDNAQTPFTQTNESLQTFLFNTVCSFLQDPTSGFDDDVDFRSRFLTRQRRAVNPANIDLGNAFLSLRPRLLSQSLSNIPGASDLHLEGKESKHLVVSNVQVKRLVEGFVQKDSQGWIKCSVAFSRDAPRNDMNDDVTIGELQRLFPVKDGGGIAQVFQKGGPVAFLKYGGGSSRTEPMCSKVKIVAGDLVKERAGVAPVQVENAVLDGKDEYTFVGFVTKQEVVGGGPHWQLDQGNRIALKLTRDTDRTLMLIAAVGGGNLKYDKLASLSENQDKGIVFYTVHTSILPYFSASQVNKRVVRGKAQGFIVGFFVRQAIACCVNAVVGKEFDETVVVHMDKMIERETPGVRGGAQVTGQSSQLYIACTRSSGPLEVVGKQEALTCFSGGFFPMSPAYVSSHRERAARKGFVEAYVKEGNTVGGGGCENTVRLCFASGLADAERFIAVTGLGEDAGAAVDVALRLVTMCVFSNDSMLTSWLYANKVADMKLLKLINEVTFAIRDGIRSDWTTLTESGATRMDMAVLLGITYCRGVEATIQSLVADDVCWGVAEVIQPPRLPSPVAVKVEVSSYSGSGSMADPLVHVGEGGDDGASVVDKYTGEGRSEHDPITFVDSDSDDDFLLLQPISSLSGESAEVLGGESSEMKQNESRKRGRDEVADEEFHG